VPPVPPFELPYFRSMTPRHDDDDGDSDNDSDRDDGDASSDHDGLTTPIWPCSTALIWPARAL
jgi:hypothetical protein